MKYFEWYVSYITSTANPYTIGSTTYMQCSAIEWNCIIKNEWMNERHGNEWKCFIVLANAMFLTYNTVYGI